MNLRLLKFLEAENISQSQFADSIGVARASISHIISGRNKPGYDFIENTMRHYPALNIEWLITGNGKMYKLDSIGTPDRDNDINSDSAVQDPIIFPVVETETDNKAQPIENKRIITKIIVYYNDNTFEEIV